MNDNQLAFELKDIKLEDFHMEEVGPAVPSAGRAGPSHCRGQPLPQTATRSGSRQWALPPQSGRAWAPH